MSSDLELQERMNDVVLRVRHEGISWRMPAHSLILASKSSTFQEMLDERAEDEKPTPLSLVDVRPETVLAVLKYIYEGEFPADVTADLIIAARNYRLDPLRDSLELRLREDVTIPQACQMLEELNQRDANNSECCIRRLCYNMLERHALTVFGSDLIMSLGKVALTTLLASDCLNIPDDAYLFWGIWRWGRRQSSMNGRPLRDQDIAAYIDDLTVLIRKASLRNKTGIPSFVFERFNSCKPRRRRYVCPSDILKHTSSIQPCTTWQDIIDTPKTSDDEDGPFCIQLSVEKDVLLVGLSLEMCGCDSVQSFIRVLQEGANLEVRRQEIEWNMTPARKFSPRGDPESRMESDVIFHTPLFLIAGNIYSIQILGNLDSCHFVWGSFRKRRVKVGNSFVKFHGHGVTTVREMHLIPDVSVSWGPRGVVV